MYNIYIHICMYIYIVYHRFIFYCSYHLPPHQPASSSELSESQSRGVSCGGNDTCL